MSNRWNNTITKIDAETNTLRNNVERAFFDELNKSGYQRVTLPILDYADNYVINGGYHAIQNHYKSISTNGEVYSLPNDLVIGLNSVANGFIEKKGRLCGATEIFNFLPENTEPSNDYQIGAIAYGMKGVEIEAEVIALAYDFVKFIGISNPRIYLSNTNIFQGVLNTNAGTNAQRSRLKNILKGKIESDADYSTYQVLNALKNTEGSVTIIQEVAEKVNNKQSIDGLLNLFEISTVLEAYNINDSVVIKPSYYGNNEYDEGMVFFISDDKGRVAVMGGTCKYKKGKEQVDCVQMQLNVKDVIDIVKETKVFDTDSITVHVCIAASRQALLSAFAIKEELKKEGMITKFLYDVTEKDVMIMMQKNKEKVIMYVDEEGKIIHS